VEGLCCVAQVEMGGLWCSVRVEQVEGLCCVAQDRQVQEQDLTAGARALVLAGGMWGVELWLEGVCEPFTGSACEHRVTDKRMHMHVHAHTHALANMHDHTYIYAHNHAHAFTHIYTHTHK